MLTPAIKQDFLLRNAFNLPRMYLHRYLRYTPVLAALVLFTVSLTKFVGDGPLFDFDSIQETCHDNWYWALLHVQNYVVPNKQCLEHSWYLSVDFQLFLLSPLLIFPIWKWGWKKVLWIFPTLILLSEACIFTSSYRNDLTAFVVRM